MHISIGIYNTFNFLGIISLGISGGIVAIKNKMDLSGALLLGFVTANGGGTIRDLILGTEVFWLNQTYIVLLSLFSAFVIFLIYYIKLVEWGDKKLYKFIFNAFDTMGLAAFTLVGVSKALSLGEPAIICIMMGVLTASGGGMMRDIIARDTPVVLKGQFYLTPSVIGSTVFVLGLFNSSVMNTTICLVIIIVLRVLGIVYDWGLPKAS